MVTESGNVRGQRRAAGPSTSPSTLTHPLRSPSTLYEIPPLWQRQGRHTRDHSEEEIKGEGGSHQNEMRILQSESRGHPTSCVLILVTIP